MKLIITFFIQTIAILALWLTMTIPVFAIALEGRLISSDSSTLEIYPQPNREQSAIGTENVGNKVLILEQVYNNQGEIWDRVRLVHPPEIEGWIADSYVEREQSENASNDPYNPKNYYQLNQF